MREIKFRWVGRNKTFNTIRIKEGLTTKNILENNYPSFFSLDCRRDIGNCEFLAENLCTGQKDKNGKEVYEGDIIRFMDSTDKSTESGYDFDDFMNIGVIEYDEKLARFSVKADKDSVEDEDIFCDSFEVIGNIYENPDKVGEDK